MLCTDNVLFWLLFREKSKIVKEKNFKKTNLSYTECYCCCLATTFTKFLCSCFFCNFLVKEMCSNFQLDYFCFQLTPKWVHIKMSTKLHYEPFYLPVEIFRSFSSFNFFAFTALSYAMLPASPTFTLCLLMKLTRNQRVHVLLVAVLFVSFFLKHFQFVYF